VGGECVYDEPAERKVLLREYIVEYRIVNNNNGLKMKRLFCVLFVLSSFSSFAKEKPAANILPHKEYHVSIKGSDAYDGSVSKPFKTIMAAANVAMPGDVITVHAGVYREQITPPRGGDSEKEPIVYQAAKGEKVEIKGSEVVKGWKKLDNDTWVVKIPNNFFGEFNPYKEHISGDWFSPTPKDRKYLRGAVYLNGDWLMEAAKKEDVFESADEKNPLWYASVDGDSTTIWAQFKKADPNNEAVEINVRETVFYPDKPFINYITVRGFVMEDAATNWAPPTAEQKGLIGTHWSRGWIIENNTIQYSKCVGIALGKYGDDHDNNQTESAEGYVGTIKRALAFGWNKGTIGGHIVRNNTIAYCEQAGIVGSMGCAFSVIQGNTIHDIHMRRLFSGAEMAGIKFHGAVDVQIINNHIYRTDKGVWLDWMAQGAQLKNNLMYENDMDLFLEVDHGPTLVANNIMLSKLSVLMNANGAAFVHNLFGGAFNVVGYDGRLTPYHKPHSTFVAALHDNPGGDVQFINNLYVMEGNVRQYDKAMLPAIMSGNVYTSGTNRGQPVNYYEWIGLSDSLKALCRDKKVTGDLEKHNFDAAAKIIKEKDGIYLEINLDKNWLIEQKRQLVTTVTLLPAQIPNLPYENTDGTPLKIDTDFFGKQRNTSNPSPGPFEVTLSGIQKIKVW
jgi:alpha-N-arabinofuranosidase